MPIPNRLQRIATGALAASALALLGADAPTGRFSSTLHVTGMTFVSSRGSASELVLVAERAELSPDTNIAKLDVVHMTALDPDQSRAFDVRCDRGELNVDTNDFYAEGDVHGTTGEGHGCATTTPRGCSTPTRRSRWRTPRVPSAATASATTRRSTASGCWAT